MALEETVALGPFDRAALTAAVVLILLVVSTDPCG
jgi:hypothetical protein